MPWADRIQPGDVTSGLLMPAAGDDVRLEPGYTGGESAADADPAEQSLIRAVVAELGLGRERVLSLEGRDEAAERWLAGDGGPDNQMTKLAPDVCETCGFFVRLQGQLGMLFGVCANAYSASEASVVSVDHGCGAHSNVPSPRTAPRSCRRRSGRPSSGTRRSPCSTELTVAEAAGPAAPVDRDPARSGRWSRPSSPPGPTSRCSG